MKTKLTILSILLACSSAHSFTVNPDVYFGIARMDQGRFTFMISKQACQTKTTEPGKWMKAAIYVQYDFGETEMLDACWAKDKQPNDAYGRPIDLKVCVVVDGVLRTPCRKAGYNSFTKTSDLPKVPGQADF